MNLQDSILFWLYIIVSVRCQAWHLSNDMHQTGLGDLPHSSFRGPQCRRTGEGCSPYRGNRCTPCWKRSLNSTFVYSWWYLDLLQVIVGLVEQLKLTLGNNSTPMLEACDAMRYVLQLQADKVPTAFDIDPIALYTDARVGLTLSPSCLYLPAVKLWIAISRTDQLNPMFWQESIQGMMTKISLNWHIITILSICAVALCMYLSRAWITKR